MTLRALPWLTLLLLLLAPVTLADDDDGDESGHDEGDGARQGRSFEDADGERTVKIDVSGGKAVIKLAREAAGVEEAVKIEFDADEARVQVKHESESDGNESEHKLQARFVAVIEYVDADGDGAYDAGEPLASGYALGETREADVRVNGTADWGPVTVTDASSGNATGKKLSSRATLPRGGTFGLDFYVYGDLAVVGNATLRPTEAKIDVRIENYPYARNDSALAVLVDLKSKTEFESDGDDGKEGLAATATTGNLTYALVFTWLDTATVDGVDRPVHSTVLRSRDATETGEVQQKARVALSYARGALIVHDPTVGVDYSTQGHDAHAHETPLPAAPLVLLALAALALARRRQGPA